MSRLRVAVLAGGVSPERDISLVTAGAVLENLPRDEFDPLRVEILPGGRWSFPDATVDVVAAPVALRERGVDVVFIGLHGPWGEDGRVQGFLDVAGMPYVGSGVAPSAVAMDKIRAREVLGVRGMPLPRGVELAAAGDRPGATSLLAQLGSPLVLKLPAGGSSLEVVISGEPDELDEVLDRWLSRPGGRVLVEEHLDGDEVTSPVIGNASVGGEIETLPPVLIRPRIDASYTYRAKYEPGGTEHLCPAPLAPETVARTSALGRMAHRALLCDGLTRTDFIVPADGEPRFLEINTLPGLTPLSLCPKAAATAGTPFPELLRRLVRLAMEKGASPST